VYGSLLYRMSDPDEFSTISVLLHKASASRIDSP